MVTSSTCLALCLPVCLSLFGFGSKKQSPSERLVKAVERGDLKGTEAALKDGANPNGGKPEKDDYGYKKYTPLAVACINKDMEMIQLLVSHGANVNARSGPNSGVLPLEVAIAPSADEQSQFAEPATLVQGLKVRMGLVTYLLSKGADPKRHSRVGSTPLSVAASDGTHELVELLIAKGAAVNGQGPLDQPLAEASRRGRKEAAPIVEMLIAHHAKVDSIVPPNHETALLLAAACGNVEVAGILLAHGANVNMADKFGSTPLHLAARLSRPDMAKFLLEHGANPNALDSKKKKPVDRATGPEVKEVFAPAPVAPVAPTAAQRPAKP